MAVIMLLTMSTTMQQQSMHMQRCNSSVGIVAGNTDSIIDAGATKWQKKLARKKDASRLLDGAKLARKKDAERSLDGAKMILTIVMHMAKI